ncbi:hypothetical protein A4R26_33430 [Niastella populi]|uniref:Uncharacterized protein n=1 Tax=Niastella populi TaxID=550983 RepID=A0A1V9GA04_9BACT|nr:hypothetical protein A4R26_33430 [Niastella populi]
MKIIAKRSDLINRKIKDVYNKRYKVLEYFVVLQEKKFHFHLYVGYTPFTSTEFVNYMMQGIDELRSEFDFSFYCEKDKYYMKLKEIQLRNERYTVMQV